MKTKNYHYHQVVRIYQSTNTSKIHYRNLSSRMPNPSFNQISSPSIFHTSKQLSIPSSQRDHPRRKSLSSSSCIYTRNPFEVRVATPFLWYPPSFFRRMLSPARRSSWPARSFGSDLMAHLARVPTFLRFAFRFTLFALYSVAVGTWPSSVDIPHNAAEKRGGRGGFHFGGEMNGEKERGRIKRSEAGEEGRKKGEGGKRRKENEACLVHPLWGPDRYEGARGWHTRDPR